MSSSAPFGLGCAPLGNLYHAITDDEAEAILEAAWTAGVRWFDTAPHYGLGLSESRLGAFLARKPRSEFIVSTKVGRRLEQQAGAVGRDDDGFDVPATHRRVWDFSAAGVERTLMDSLERLRLDTVDIVLLHDPSEHLNEAVQEAAPALARLRSDGIVGKIGAGTRDLEALARLVQEGTLDVVMPAGRYTLLDQEADRVLFPLCTAAGVPVLNVGVFNSGILASPRPHDDARFEYGQADPSLLAVAHGLADLCDRHNTTLPAAAIAFAQGSPIVHAIALGAASAEEVQLDAELALAPPPPTFWQDVAAFGLIPRRHLLTLLGEAR
ncbi:hypothetical protein ASE16_02090 [Leifsonia sp. Root227]|uniref:aldo/keto reductase n=1 Tax=Leifsonia sp. Root227 TaxID=1736496 RepID=UPI0006F376E6|nr:aldo/keto reductase [Leifsonia sp. Root227]KRC51883.1 hypothetical protein ASE16_02090 [Leifsonia sp. Root227]